MSYYEDERPRRAKSTRDRPRDDYYDETVYNSRDNVRSSTAVVRRRDSSVDSVEEVRRDFSPPGGGYYRETTIRKSGTRPSGGRARSYDDDRYYDDESRYSSRRDSAYNSRRKSRDYDDRRDRRRYSDDSASSRSRTPPKKERRKSMPEEALEALGLGGVAGALLGKKEKDRSGSRDRDSRRSHSRSARGRSGSQGRSHGREQLTQALKAAVLAGAGEAFRARKEPGGWGGDKGKRVLTAAFAAGGVDGLINAHKDPETHKARDTIGSAIAGLATSRIVNGPRSKSRGRGMSPDSRNGRSRSRGGGLGDVAAGGVLAATAKKAYDSIRSRSRGGSRGRSRSASNDSYDSRSPPKRSRSRSVIARGLAAVGLDKQADQVDPARRASTHGARRYSDDYYEGGGYDNVGHQPPPPYGHPSDVGRSRSVGPGPTAAGYVTPPPGGYQLDYGPHHYGDPATDSDSDLGSSSEDEKENKKSKRRLYITGGLATVATIHAGHSVYQSVEKRNARKRALKEGKINKEEAQKNKTRDRLQEAASVGLAALGIKGAYSEWKEMKEAHEERKEHEEKIQRHAVKRANRREKMRMLGDHPAYSEDDYAHSMPNLHRSEVPPSGHYYNGAGPYNAGSPNYGGPTAGPPPMGPGPVPTQYYDDNPYGWMGHDPAAQAPPPQHPPTMPDGYPGAPPPAPGGPGVSGFPPPPVGPHSA